MKKNVKKILLIVGAILIICVLCFIMSRTSENSNYADKYEGVDLTAGAMFPDARVSVDVCEYDTGKGVTVQKEYSGKKDVLYTEDESTVTWKIEVPEAGFYQIYLEYMTVESRGVAIERSLYINGEEPFEDAANLMFGRFWTDGGEVKTREMKSDRLRWRLMNGSRHIAEMIWDMKQNRINFISKKVKIPLHWKL